MSKDIQEIEILKNLIKSINININKKEDDLKNIINEMNDKINEQNNKIKNLNERINVLMKNNEEKDKKINKLENDFSEIEEIVDDIQKDKYKDEINLIYETKKESNNPIFGETFVEINRGNIELDINGKKSDLVNKCVLQIGKNNIKMKIKKKLTLLYIKKYK